MWDVVIVEVQLKQLASSNFLHLIEYFFKMATWAIGKTFHDTGVVCIIVFIVSNLVWPPYVLLIYVKY